MIREDEALAPHPPRPPRPERDAGPGRRSHGTQAPAQEPPAVIDRDAAPALDELPAEPATAYGADDPGYGPPRPEWYAGEDQAEQQTAEELERVRGAFEPPVHQGGTGQEPASQEPAAFELPGADGATPLDQIRNFYLTAEATGPENLDRHFDELLERQRQLISGYFNEAALQDSPR